MANHFEDVDPHYGGERNNMESERLARIEEKLDGALFWMKESQESQGEKNKLFFEVRDRVNALEASARGAWKVLAILGTLSAGLGATFAFLVEHPPTFLSLSPVSSSTGSLELSHSDQGKLGPSFSRPHSH